MFYRQFHKLFWTPVFELWSWYVLFIKYIASSFFICVDIITMEVLYWGPKWRNNGLANKQLYGPYI